MMRSGKELEDGVAEWICFWLLLVSDGRGLRGLL